MNWKPKPTKKLKRAFLGLRPRSSGFQLDRRCQLNPLHVLVAGEAFVLVDPFDRDVFRIRHGDRAKVGRVAVETDKVASFQIFRLFGGHST
jgi:hypothetical protein